MNSNVNHRDRKSLSDLTVEEQLVRRTLRLAANLIMDMPGYCDSKEMVSVTDRLYLIARWLHRQDYSAVSTDAPPAALLEIPGTLEKARMIFVHHNVQPTLALMLESCEDHFQTRKVSHIYVSSAMLD